MQVLKESIPEKSIILKGLSSTSYQDCYSITLIGNYPVDELLNRFIQGPQWADRLLRLRNQIVSVFGLKTGDKDPAPKKSYYTKGDRAGLFTVFDRTENEIVMAEDDKHLYFRTSILSVTESGVQTVYSSTIVQYHNIGGRLYFFFVKPFHRRIIEATLKGLLRGTAGQ